MYRILIFTRMVVRLCGLGLRLVIGAVSLLGRLFGGRLIGQGARRVNAERG
jgi:hypothetical protein